MIKRKTTQSNEFNPFNEFNPLDPREPGNVGSSSSAINEPENTGLITENVSSENKEKLDDYLEMFKKSTEFQKMIFPRSTTLSNLQTTNVVELFAQKNKLTTNQAKIVIAMLFQAGGTNRSCDGNLQVSIFDKEIKLASLRKCLSECKLRGSERKLARSLATEIYKISLTLNIPGNLAKKIAREYPDRDFSIEQAAWLSEFQAENPDCPDEIRQLILETFKNRKANTNTKSNNKK